MLLQSILLMVAMHVRAFMNGTCETVVIVTDAGPVVINKSDYDANPAQYMLHDAGALRDDGPTIAEFIAAGYSASNYPPQGYASKSTVEEIAAAVADEAAKIAAAQPPQTPAPAPAAATLAQVATEGGATVPASAASPLMVMKEGKGKEAKHFVVNAAGEKVVAEGIDAAGYAMEQDAWNAIIALPH
jgi:hypothetical protein